MFVAVAPKNELRCGYSDGRSDVNQIQLWIVARNHPRADVPPLLQRNVAPCLIARLSGFGNGVGSPQFLAGLCIMCRDDASLVAGARLALAACDDLAIDDDGAGACVGGFCG